MRFKEQDSLILKESEQIGLLGKQPVERDQVGEIVEKVAVFRARLHVHTIGNRRSLIRFCFPVLMQGKHDLPINGEIPCKLRAHGFAQGAKGLRAGRFGLGIAGGDFFRTITAIPARFHLFADLPRGERFAAEQVIPWMRWFVAAHGVFR